MSQKNRLDPIERGALGLFLVLGLVIALPAPSEGHSDPSLTLALKYVPPDIDEDDVIDVTGLHTFTLHVKPPIDIRREPERIGVNVEDDDPVAILTTTPTADFVEEAIRSTLFELGLTHGDDDGLSLETRIQEFYVVESAVYRASVRLRLSVYRDDAEIWAGLAVGSDTRWGRSLNSENYIEVLSESVRDALEEAFTDPGFRSAIRDRHRH